MSDQGDRLSTAERQAAEWFARLGASRVSMTELASFRRWRENPENEMAYRSLEQVWSAAGAIGDDPEVQIVLGGAPRTKTPLKAPASSAPRNPAWRPAIAAAAVLVMASAGFGVWRFAGDRNVISAPDGDQRVVSLADGSQVRVDADSRIRVRFTPQGRDIELLQGRAYFDVAPDSARPFSVAAGSTTVTAVGTAFSVRLADEGAEVILVEGRVDVAPRRARPGQTRRWSLEPGQKLRVGAESSLIETVDADAETGWIEGRLTFLDRPLSEAVAEVNRYADAKVRLEGAGIAEIRISGNFHAGDSAAFAEAAAALLELEQVRGHREVVLRRPVKN